MKREKCIYCAKPLNPDTRHRCTNCCIKACPECAKIHFSSDPMTCKVCAESPRGENANP